MIGQEQIRLAEAFRNMHAGPRPLLLPNAWDALSAQAFVSCGFGAVATTSAGLAWALGYGDGEQVPRDEMIAAVRRIVRAVRVPVTADIEAGFGKSADEVAQTVTAIIEAGVVGINLEDGIPGAHGTMRDLDEASGRIRAAREAADATGVRIVVNARTDLYFAPARDESARFEEVVRRCQAYLQAGADCVYPIGLGRAEAIGELVRRVNAPVNVMGRPTVPTLAELERLGVRRVSTASAPALMAFELTRKIGRDLLASGSFDGLASGVQYAELQELFRKR